MVAPLKRALVCSPRTAGWNRPEPIARWRELGFHHPPDFPVAQKQHATLCHQLAAAGAEVIELPPAFDLSLDAVYTHDSSLSTDFGLLLMRPGKPNRTAEAEKHGSFARLLGIPTVAGVVPPGATEAGDMVWLDEPDEDVTPSGALANGRLWDEMGGYYFFLLAKSVGEGWDTAFSGAKRPFFMARGMMAGLGILMLVSLLFWPTAPSSLPTPKGVTPA